MDHSTIQIKDVLHQAEQWSDAEIQTVIQQLAMLIESRNHEDLANDDIPFTDQEIIEMLTPKKALTGKEIVEAGLAGGWGDLGITDGAEYIQEKRTKRRASLKW